MDVMSGGRVAWNIVTSAAELEARNVGGSLPPREETLRSGRRGARSLLRAVE